MHVYKDAARYRSLIEEIRDVCWGVGLDHRAWLSLTAAHQYIPALRELRSYVPRQSSVLDWGSGYGLFSLALLKLGFKVTAYDFFEEMVTFPYLRDAGDWDYVRASGSPTTSLPFQSHQFDAVTSIGVLEHVRVTGGDEMGALAEIHRILKPGGVFLISHLPNSGSWIEWVARRQGRGHEFRYSIDQSLSLLVSSGFHVEKVWRQGMLPRNVMSRLPTVVANSSPVASLVDCLDGVLGAVGSRVAQNWGFVCRAT